MILYKRFLTEIKILLLCMKNIKNCKNKTKQYNYKKIKTKAFNVIYNKICKIPFITIIINQTKTHIYKSEPINKDKVKIVEEIHQQVNK